MVAHFLQYYPTLTPFSQTVQITSNGKTADAQIVDTCPGCGPNDLGECDTIDGLAGWIYRLFPADMSPALFQHFASLDVGVISIDWDELN